MRPVLAGLWLLFAAAPAARADDGGGPTVDLRLSTKGNDIAFDQTAIQVPFGTAVKLKFVNEAAKGSEIQHNVAVLKPGTLDAVMKELQASGYDLAKMRANKSIIAMTKMLEPGSTETLEFTPDAPGFYPYICLMPGHADMLGMKGTLNVVKK
jgi:plastocyanin